MDAVAYPDVAEVMVLCPMPTIRVVLESAGLIVPKPAAATRPTSSFAVKSVDAVRLYVLVDSLHPPETAV